MVLPKKFEEDDFYEVSLENKNEQISAGSRRALHEVGHSRKFEPSPGIGSQQEMEISNGESSKSQMTKKILNSHLFCVF